MSKVIILRYGEIYLKGKNRGMFEKFLLNNTKDVLKDVPCEIKRISGRYLVSNFDENDLDILISKLTKVFGFVSLSVADEMVSDKDVIFEYAKTIKIENTTFKVETKRADKTFPIQSFDFSPMVGSVICDNNPTAVVDVHKPKILVDVDIRENGKTYISYSKIKCAGGMPVGTSGKGMLLLSGGIDSPVAGYMMAKRGLKISAIHFHSFPYTSEQAKQKVVSLAKILTGYTGNIELFVVPFTKIQEQIHINCKSDYMITIMRRFMMRITERICKENNISCIITGENLAQVASQTVESMTSTESVLKELPIYRPVIGFDKIDIIEISNQIGTYETSVLPYEDCCTVFLPKSPIIKPKLKNVENQEKALLIDELVDEAILNTEKIVL